LKEHLEGEIDWHDQKLEEIERVCEVGADEEPQKPQLALSNETPGRLIRGLRRSRLGTT
jgi:hypothetical protein